MLGRSFLKYLPGAGEVQGQDHIRRKQEHTFTVNFYRIRMIEREYYVGETPSSWTGSRGSGKDSPVVIPVDTPLP